MRYRWHELEGIAIAGSGAARSSATVGAAIVAALLRQRGHGTPAAVEAFLSPTPQTLAEPLLLADLDRAIARLRLAHARQELVAIWGDYDVDGLTSTTLLCRALGGMGLRVRPLIPHRTRDGYGLNIAGIARLAGEGVRLIVAVDCGISDRAEIDHARSCGVDVIVLDHHTIPPEMPEAAAVVNPRRADCAYPFKDHAAVGIAYTLVRALAREPFVCGGAWSEDEPELVDLLGLAALGTVADVAPLQGENRTIVTWGLDALRHTAYPGVQALCAVAGIDRARLTAWDLGHALGPRLNAAGRMADPAPALRLLLTDSYEEALPLAQELDRLNRERQRELSRILEEAIARVEHDGLPDETRPILQVDGTGWTAGVVGLVAGRLAERYGRPAIVLERGATMSTGSARSVDGFNLVEALAECADLLDRFGGHARAAGLTVANHKLDELRERLLTRARARLTADDLRPTLTLDLELALADLTYPTVDALARLEPFGQGNPEPLILLRDVGTQWPKTSGDGKHLFFIATAQAGRPVRAPVRCVAFGQGARRPDLLDPARGGVDLVGTLRRERWQGEERLSFHIRDFRRAGSV